MSIFAPRREIPEMSRAELEAEAAQLRRDIEKLTHELDDARRAAYTDALTGLPNRHGYDRYVAALKSLARTPEFQAALDGGHLGGLLVAQVDIDHFKSVNTILSHFGADLVLKEFGARLAEGARTQTSIEHAAAAGRSLASLMVQEYLSQNGMEGTDLISRWGGEEFFCLFPLCYRDAAAAQTAYDDADQIMKRMIERIRKKPFTVPVNDATYDNIKHHVIGKAAQYYQNIKLLDNKGKFAALPLSASIGYAVISWQEFTEVADGNTAYLFRNVVDLMRRAKQNGRNRAVTVRASLHDQKAAIHVFEGRSLTQSDISGAVRAHKKP